MCPPCNGSPDLPSFGFPIFVWRSDFTLVRGTVVDSRSFDCQYSAPGTWTPPPRNGPPSWKNRLRFPRKLLETAAWHPTSKHPVTVPLPPTQYALNNTMWKYRPLAEFPVQSLNNGDLSEPRATLPCYFTTHQVVWYGSVVESCETSVHAPTICDFLQPLETKAGTKGRLRDLVAVMAVREL